MRSAAVLIFAVPGMAHVVSMSTGEAILEGARLDYEIRMPLYEVAHISHPEQQLLDSVSFRSPAGAARLLQRSCREDSGNLICRGLYLFDREVDQFEVRCTLASVTVPNHIHLLRAVHGTRIDQAAFDASFTEATIRFRPPTVMETAVRDASAGFWRAIAGPAQLLFLGTLVLAARGRKELGALFGMFAAGQMSAVLAGLSMRLPVSPRFMEAAAALTIAYLAVEILLLPAAGQRWVVVGVLGVLHGIWFDMLLAGGNYGAGGFLSGVILAEAVAVGILWVAAAGVGRMLAKRSFLIERGLAAVLLLTGLSWFLLRLRS